MYATLYKQDLCMTMTMTTRVSMGMSTRKCERHDENEK